MAKRGELTGTIKRVALVGLGIKDFTIRELRLMPYIQYTMMNNQKIDPNHINQEEREIISRWKKKGWMDGGMTGLSITKEFWDVMNKILWLGYVNYEES